MRNSTRERSIGKTVFATIALIAIVMAGMAVWQHPSTVQALVGPTLKVEPSEYHAKKIGETFSININIYDVTAAEKLVGFDFSLGYNKTLLRVEEVKNGTFLEKFAGPPNEGVHYIGPKNGTGVLSNAGYIRPETTDDGGVYHEPFPSGSGTLTTIVFRVIYQPLVPQPSASCNLTLFHTILGNYTPPNDSNPIPHNVVNGYYDIVPAAIMAVEPSAYHATRVGETFSVDIVITVVASQKVVGFEFTLQFSDDLLEYVKLEPGPFLEAFAAPPNGGMFYFGPNNGTGWVRYAGTAFPESTDFGGVYHEPFLSGTGAIASITFITKAPPTPFASCNLTLFNTMLGDYTPPAVPGGPADSNPVPHVTRDGYYDITIPTLVGDIDGNGEVDIYDAQRLALAFGAGPADPNWNALADLNHDDTVDIFDAILLGKHFGEHA